ncbi:MAG: glycosyltransferase family 4 protein [Candidatus Omnitrophota bacterium]
MNILYLTTHLNVGGITSYLLTLSEGLKKRGHNVYVAADSGELLPRFLDKGITYIPLSIKTKSEISPKVLISLVKLLPEIKKKNIEIIHANTRVTEVLACLAGYLTRRRFVSTAHGFYRKGLFRKIFPCWGARVIAISQQVKTHLMEDFNVKEEELRLINNGIDVDKFTVNSLQRTAGYKKIWGLGDGPVIGIIARLSDVKGHIYLIQAMKLVLEKYPEAQLLIVGEGKIKDELVSLIRKLKIEKQVFLLPNAADTKEALSIMDIFALPSLKEGLGLSLMEAMAMGIAVIGSNAGGIKSLIRDGFSGLLVEPRNYKQLSQAIIGLLDDPGKRKVFGENARVFIEKNFSQEKMVLETERMYIECLNAG